jgi:acyl-CoA thioesterase
MFLFVLSRHADYPIAYTNRGINICDVTANTFIQSDAYFFGALSFQRTEVGFTHQDPMPAAPDPEEVFEIQASVSFSGKEY